MTPTTRWKASGWLLPWLLAVLLWLPNRGISASEPGDLENKVKAACLYNFAMNAEWPAGAFTSPDAPFVIGLMGDAAFSGMLEKGVDGKKVQGRTVTARRLREVSEAWQCQIVFFSAGLTPSTVDLLSPMASRPILTVGEEEQFARRGGVLNFIKLDGTIRFEANPKAAGRAGIKLGSQLLKLAVLVKD